MNQPRPEQFQARPALRTKRQAWLTRFPAAYATDAAGFVADEIARADRVSNEYRIAVFRIIPLTTAVCALAIPCFESPLWRA
ncbi:hypothetical protein ACR03S_09400 [Limimaricola variabilis]